MTNIPATVEAKFAKVEILRQFLKERPKIAFAILASRGIISKRRMAHIGTDMTMSMPTPASARAEGAKSIKRLKSLQVKPITFTVGTLDLRAGIDRIGALFLSAECPCR